jgi:hypothetical protein
MKDGIKRDIQLFNTPVEIGFRAITLLSEMAPKVCDIQRLVFYDYLLLHSNDVQGGPPSLHPPMPYRTCEILIRSELLLNGLKVMISKELADVEFTDKGRQFKATVLTRPFLEHLDSSYAKSLKISAKWVIENFNGYSDEKLETYIKDNLSRWGGEFSKETLEVENFYE